MSRSIAAIAVIAAIGVWIYALHDRATDAPFAHVHRAAPPPPHVAALAAKAAPNTVQISGVVYDDRQTPVAGVDVVIVAGAGEARATTDSEGAWAAAVLRGTYHIYVRGSGVIAVGETGLRHLDTQPFARAADVPDDALMPALTVTGDTPNLELSVIRAATITGKIIDEDDNPIAGAIVHAKAVNDASWLAPVLGTDTARTDALGTFKLSVAPGSYVLETAHKRFATHTTITPTDVEAGATVDTADMLTRGCQIDGRVIEADGRPSGGGALELGEPVFGFRVGGPIAGDGTFRLASDDVDDLTLRGWPWRSGPTAPRTFPCRDGARFEGVTFTVPRDQQPDLEGTIVDAAGQPVPLAYIEVAPVDTDAPHQQERASSDGSFRVFDAPTGRYHLMASSSGRGVANATVSSPSRTERIAFGGTGRVAGTVTGIANGSFEATFETCLDIVDTGLEPMRLPHESRIVRVVGGRFAIDGAPACKLALVARWRGIAKPFEATVAANATTTVELELGTAPDKIVRGVIRDRAHAPIDNARVTARLGDRVIDTVSTGADGRFSVRAVAGAELTVSASGRSARAMVGLANVGDEELDVSLNSK